MVDRVPEVSGQSSTHNLSRQQIDAWRHALVTAGHEFSAAADRLRESIQTAPVAGAGEVVTGAQRLVAQLKQQARDAWAASDMLESAAEVIVRTAPEGGVA